MNEHIKIMLVGIVGLILSPAIIVLAVIASPFLIAYMIGLEILLGFRGDHRHHGHGAGR